MPVLLTMKDTIVDLTVDEDFVGLVNNLNLAMASGKHFAIMEDMQGTFVMVSIPNIIYGQQLPD